MTIKVGDKVRLLTHGFDSKGRLTLEKVYTVLKVNNNQDQSILVLNDNGDRWWVEKNILLKVTDTKEKETTKEKTNMLDSVKEYLKDNKQILMTIGVALLVDHLVFGGAFREKVKGLVDSMLSSAQKKLDEGK